MEVTWSFAEIAMAVRSDHSYKLFSMKPEELKIISNGASKGSVSQGAQIHLNMSRKVLGVYI